AASPPTCSRGSTGGRRRPRGHPIRGRFTSPPMTTAGAPSSVRASPGPRSPGSPPTTAPTRTCARHRTGGFFTPPAPPGARRPPPARPALPPPAGPPPHLPSPTGQVQVPGRLTEVEATADDGAVIRGWLALPVAASEHQPAPLLLWVHGGPRMSWNSWSW